MVFVVHDEGVVRVLEAPLTQLDADNSKDFKQSFRDTVEGKAKVILDLGRLEFVDSSGLGALLSCLRVQTAQEGTLKLCSMTKTVRAMFELVRMHRVFEVYNTLDEAVRSHD